MTTIEALDAAYETCLLVKSNSDNVLASLDKTEDGTADKEWSRQAGKFIRWYESKKRREGWQDRLTKSIDKLFKTIDNT